MFAYVDTSNLTIEQLPIVSRYDSRIISLHRSHEAAEARAAKEFRRLRRTPGQESSSLFRTIVEL